MKLILTFLTLCASLLLAHAQSEDFESIVLPSSGFLNGADQSRGFATNFLFFPNRYNPDFGGFWASGWAISNRTDSTTAGFANLYSARPGSGGPRGNQPTSANYAIGQQRAVIRLNSPRYFVTSIDLTNTTYAYFSMLRGDQFAKKFGGSSGNDPDFFRLTIRGYRRGQLLPDSVNVLLADFRFADNQQDFILKNWQTVAIPPSVGICDSLQFVLSSSDVGAFGINTPLFFAIDNVRLSVETSAVYDSQLASQLQLYPNPTTGSVQLNWTEAAVTAGWYSLYDPQGRLLQRTPGSSASSQLDLSAQAPGLYHLHWTDGQRFFSKKISKIANP